MKTLLKTTFATIALAATGLTAMPAEAAYGYATIVNYNYYNSIERVWTAPVGYAWSETYLNYAIQPNKSSYIDWNDTAYCLYDIKVQLSNGTTKWYKDVNVCRGDSVHVY